MHIRCSYCRHSFNIGRDYIGEAVKTAAEKRQRYHGLECPNCRKLIKVPIKQMRRFAPRPSLEEEKPDEEAA
jgi:DNA-directed RNA polymerase subunit RPC12/RpoP